MKSLIVYSILSIVASTAEANLNLESTRLARARQVETALAHSGFSGSVVLRCGSKTYLNKSFGPRAQNIQGKYFDIGSQTKQFTAAAIVKLVEDKKLKLEDPISKFVSGLPPELQKITIEQLLTHQSGLTNPKIPPEEEPEEDFASMRSEVIGYKPKANALKDFEDESRYSLTSAGRHDGSEGKFRYYNGNYSVLAYVIHKVSGQPYNEFVKREIFSPLGMGCGFNDHKSIDRSQAASGYYEGRALYQAGYYADEPGETGTTGIVCRAEDLAKWYEGQQQIIKDPSMLNRLRYLEGSSLRVGDEGYGYGVSYNKPYIGHRGNTVGFSSDSRYNPQNGCMAISLSDEADNFFVTDPLDIWFKGRVQAPPGEEDFAPPPSPTGGHEN